MDFLDKLVLPHSEEHLILLKYLLVLTFIVFVPYLSLLVGSTIYSLYFNFKQKKNPDAVHKRLSTVLIDVVTYRKSFPVALGIIPLISAAFLYAQLLHTTGLNVGGYLLLALLLFLISVFFLYVYKYSVHIDDLFSIIDDKSLNQSDINTREKYYEYKTRAFKIYNFSGIAGLALLIAASYIFIASVDMAFNMNKWGDVSILQRFFSWSTIFYFGYFILSSLAITSAGLLFYYFRPVPDEIHESHGYLEFVKKFGISTGLIFTISLPVFVILNIITLPDASLSGLVFTAAILALFLLLILANLFYLMIKENRVKFVNTVIVLFVLVFLFIIIRDQSAFSSASGEQMANMASEFEEYEAALKEKMGLSAVAINGEEIYGGRCVACHAFDQKIVGPAYNNVLPKYEGSVEELASFILNPVKVNPDFPPMPAQGLKPAEATAVAEYIMNVYQGEEE